MLIYSRRGISCKDRKALMKLCLLLLITYVGYDFVQPNLRKTYLDYKAVKSRKIKIRETKRRNIFSHKWKLKENGCFKQQNEDQCMVDSCLRVHARAWAHGRRSSTYGAL